jgi:hypothetical protein
MARRSLQPVEATMSELLFVLSLFVVLVWVIVRAVLLVVEIDAPESVRDIRDDPISTYVEENYGSHFHRDTMSVNQSLRSM